MKIPPIAFGFVFLFAFPAAGQPASLDLARRYVAASGGMTVPVLAVHMGILKSDRCMQSMTCHATATGRFKAVQQAIDQDRPAMEAADDRLAHIVAQTLGTSELEGYLAFWESPDGRSIQRKRAIQGIVFYRQERVPRGLTKAEQDALAAYLHTPVALAINAKEHALLDRSIRFEAQLQVQIAKDAGAIYCRHTGYCTDWVQETK